MAKAAEAAEEAWRHVYGVWPRIEKYERRAGRRVPVFRLIPR